MTVIKKIIKTGGSDMFKIWFSLHKNTRTVCTSGYWAGRPHMSQGVTLAAAFMLHRAQQQLYLHKESVAFIFTLNGLDCYILSFPHSLEDNSKRPSAHSLHKDNTTVQYSENYRSKGKVHYVDPDHGKLHILKIKRITGYAYLVRRVIHCVFSMENVLLVTLGFI